MMCLARLLGPLGLLHVVVAWVGDAKLKILRDSVPNTGTKSGQPRRNGIGRLLNNSYANTDGIDVPLHLRQPKLPPPAPELPEVLRHIRCCNAYASYYSLQVLHKEDEIMHGIAYGHCQDRDVAVRVGDPLELQVNNQNQVTFLESSRVEQDSVLLLVAYKDVDSNMLKFKSHVYKHAQSESSTVVTMNLYDGSQYYKGWQMVISDDEGSKTYRSETLSDMEYDAVVSVHPGKYLVTLKEGKRIYAKKRFVAKPNRLYTILRIGSGAPEHVDDQGRRNFPSGLVVWPLDQPEDEQKSAASKFHLMLSLAIVSVLHIVPQN